MKMFGGNLHAKSLENTIQKMIKKRGSPGTLAIIQIGDDPASEKYVNLKLRFCFRSGIKAEFTKISEVLSDELISQKVESIFSDPNVQGGIIQLPLPRKSLNFVLNLIPLTKDIDNLSSKSVEQFKIGKLKRMSPVVRSFQYFLEQNSLKPKNMKIVVIGNGTLVGKPIIDFLLQGKVKPIVLDDYKSGERIDADLLVLSTNTPNLVDGSDVKSGCHVIDFGSAIVNKKSVGNLDLNSKISHLGIVSPSPGGMGPLVVRFLVINFLSGF